jgi:nicotinamidase-related amidase
MEGFAPLPDERLIVGKPALLIIDMQHDFMDTNARCYNPGAEDTVEPTARLIELFRRQGLPVIFTREAHRPGRIDAGIEADAAYHIPPHTVEGTYGYEIIEPLAPLEDELVVDKRRYNCFLGTELELLLKGAAIDTLVICGVSSDMCVHWTAGEAFQRDFHTRVVEDCTAGMGVADHYASLLMLRNLCSGGRAISSDDIVHALAAEDALAIG